MIKEFGGKKTEEEEKSLVNYDQQSSCIPLLKKKLV